MALALIAAAGGFVAIRRAASGASASPATAPAPAATIPDRQSPAVPDSAPPSGASGAVTQYRRPARLVADVPATGGAATGSAESTQPTAEDQEMDRLVRATGARVRRPAAFLVDRHFLRKHGRDAYYGQGKR